MQFPVALSLALIIPLGLAAFSFAMSLSIDRRHPPEGRLCGAPHDENTPRPPNSHRGARRARDAAVADIVLIHGAFASLGDQLLALADPLCARYRVFAVDRPGQGWSDRSDGASDASLRCARRSKSLRRSGARRRAGRGHRPFVRSRRRRGARGRGARAWCEASSSSRPRHIPGREASPGIIGSPPRRSSARSSAGCSRRPSAPFCCALASRRCSARKPRPRITRTGPARRAPSRRGAFAPMGRMWRTSSATSRSSRAATARSRRLA